LVKVTTANVLEAAGQWLRRLPLVLRLNQKRVAGGGRLPTVVLVDAHIPIRVQGVGDVGTEADGVHVERITAPGLFHNKVEY
jgi:hypothetical protein